LRRERERESERQRETKDECAVAAVDCSGEEEGEKRYPR